MRKLLLAALGFLLLTSGLRALEWHQDFSIAGLGWNPYFTVAGKWKDSLVLGRNLDGQAFYDVVPLSSLVPDQDGFYSLTAFGSRLVLVGGGNFLFFHDLVDSQYSMYRPDKDFRSYSKQVTFFEDPRTGYRTIGDRYRSIRKIVVPDVLEEKIGGRTVRYSTEDMETYYARMLDGQVVCNPEARPWATSKNPVGLNITIDFESVQSSTGGLLLGKSDHLVVLNGYVNPLKRNLYKANRRIKSLLVESNEASAKFAIKVSFDDTVGFLRIPFPKAVSGVKLTILEYYEGERFKDLCVQWFGTDFDLNSGVDFLDQYQKKARPWRS